MLRVYVAGLYSKNADGSTANVIEVLNNMRRGLRVTREIIDLGFAPFCPWLDYLFHLTGDGPIDIKWCYAFSIKWLEVSDCMLVISGEGIGGGVDKEVKIARDLDIPTFRSIKELVWFSNAGK